MPAGRRWPAAADLLFALALGALHSLAFVHPLAWPLQAAVIAALGWRVREAAGGRAAGLGLAFGTAWFGAGTWWLYISMHHYGGLPAWLTVLDRKSVV